MHLDSLLNELSLSHEFGVVRPYRAFFILCQFDIHFFVCSVTKDEEVAGLKVIKVKKNPVLSTILLSHSCSALMLLPCS